MPEVPAVPILLAEMATQRSSGDAVSLSDVDRNLVGSLERFFARCGQELAAVYLFGSVARGVARDESDVDLGLLFVETPEPRLGGPRSRIEDALEARLRRPVQAVVLNAAPPDLVHRVLRDGILVHETDSSARIRFEVAARNAYFDLQPVLREYRRGGATRR